MRHIKEFIIVFGIGGIGYSLVEILFRGFTHWTMTITGGLIFYIIYHVFNIIQKENIIKICFVGAVMITTAEYAVGCIVNILLKMHVWDYSHKNLNLYGQICPAFSFGWFAISIPVFFLSIGLKESFKKRNIIF